jgi:predicted nucleotidyltransferase
LGGIRVKALIKDAGEAIYTPCRYLVEAKSTEPPFHGDVTELVSFRGKFTEQAADGMEVEARGTLEEAVYPGRTVYRVVLGGRGDYMVPVSL